VDATVGDVTTSKARITYRDNIRFPKGFSTKAEIEQKEAKATNERDANLLREIFYILEIRKPAVGFVYVVM
jgi:hypothetical protein